MWRREKGRGADQKQDEQIGPHLVSGVKIKLLSVLSIYSPER